MSSCKVTVIIPTYDHGPTLNYSIASVLRQTMSELELFVICDGAPESTIPIVEKFAAKDKRVQLVNKPKSKRTGEPYRHEILQNAHGEIVCYLGDDDLWLPDHLEIIHRALQGHNYAHTMHLNLKPDNSDFAFWPCDLSQRYYRELLLSGDNRISLSDAGHTLSFYKKLPYGWRTTPKGVPTDLYMWQQFITHPEFDPASIFIPTVLHFASPDRKGWSLTKRCQELDAWSKLISSPAGYQKLRYDLLGKVGEDIAKRYGEFQNQSSHLQQETRKLREMFAASKQEQEELVKQLSYWQGEAQTLRGYYDEAKAELDILRNPAVI